MGAPSWLGWSRDRRGRDGHDVVAAPARFRHRAAAMEAAGADSGVSGATARAAPRTDDHRRRARFGHPANLWPATGVAHGVADAGAGRSDHPVEPGCAQLQLAVAAVGVRLSRMTPAKTFAG